jgi:hypothetical protein
MILIENKEANIRVEIEGRLQLGRDVSFKKNTQIKCKSLYVGDYTDLHENWQVRNCGDIFIGDYGVIYQNSMWYGPEPISNGHHFFLGQDSVLNSYAEVSI